MCLLLAWRWRAAALRRYFVDISPSFSVSAMGVHSWSFTHMPLRDLVWPQLIVGLLSSSIYFPFLPRLLLPLLHRILFIILCFFFFLFFFLVLVLIFLLFSSCLFCTSSFSSTNSKIPSLILLPANKIIFTDLHTTLSVLMLQIISTLNTRNIT